MALGSVSLLYQGLRSLPAGEGKRLHGVKTSVARVFSSNEPVHVRATLQSLCLLMSLRCFAN